MGVIERLAVSWEDASFAVIAAIAWLSASLMCCPEVGVQFVSKAGIEITAVIPLLGPIVGLIEDDDRDFQEDDLELGGLPDVRLVWPSSLTISQITPPQSVSPSALTPAQHPLRC
jgi:hypothetical protein